MGHLRILNFTISNLKLQILHFKSQMTTLKFQISHLLFGIAGTMAPLQAVPFLGVAGRFVASLEKSVFRPACFSAIRGLTENT